MFVCLFFRISRWMGKEGRRGFDHTILPAAMGMMLWFGSWTFPAEAAERKPVESASAAAIAAVGEGQSAQITVVPTPTTAERNPFYVSNRPPLAPSPFVKLPIGSITPRRWLRGQLLLAQHGMAAD